MHWPSSAIRRPASGSAPITDSLDGGHFYYATLAGNFSLDAYVTVAPQHRYGQAGRMVRLSPDCWLKTSTSTSQERLGAVVTNAGYSGWSAQDAPDPCAECWLRLHREECVYVIEAPLDGTRYSQLRVSPLLEDPGSASAVAAGVYACSPNGGASAPCSGVWPSAKLCHNHE